MSQFYLHPAPQSSLNPHATFPHGGSSGQHHNNSHHHNNHHHHGHRSRRTPRYSNSANSMKWFKNNRNHHRGAGEAAHVATVRKDFEAARSFELDDDEMFCPWHLLTEDDLQSIHSSSSERSSASGDSPETSPLPAQLQPQSSFQASSASNNGMPQGFHHGNAGQLKLHQPLAQRTLHAIPIVDPNSRSASPPTSISPGRQMQKPYAGRRW